MPACRTYLVYARVSCPAGVVPVLAMSEAWLFRDEALQNANGDLQPTWTRRSEGSFRERSRDSSWEIAAFNSLALYRREA